MTRTTLDAGALIAIERGTATGGSLVRDGVRIGARFVVPAAALAQVWRDGRRQARLSRFLGAEGVVVEPMDERAARAAGMLCALAGTADVVDASVVWCARQHGGRVITSDPDDLQRLDPSLDVVGI